MDFFWLNVFFALISKVMYVWEFCCTYVIEVAPSSKGVGIGGVWMIEGLLSFKYSFGYYFLFLFHFSWDSLKHAQNGLEPSYKPKTKEDHKTYDELASFRLSLSPFFILRFSPPLVLINKRKK